MIHKLRHYPSWEEEEEEEEHFRSWTRPILNYDIFCRDQTVDFFPILQNLTRRFIDDLTFEFEVHYYNTTNNFKAWLFVNY